MSDSISHALASLPHGPEFRFVDRLTSLDPGKKGTGEYLVRGDELFLRGHFPGYPLFPGVLLVEAAAQLAGTVAQSDREIAPLKNVKLTAMRNVKILGSARPGETLQIEAEINGRLANLINARAKVTVGTTVVMQCELTLSGE